MTATMSPWTESRTPAEVLADGMFILTHRGFFTSRERIAAAATAVGLSMEDLRLAAGRLQENPGRYRPPAGSVRPGSSGGPSPAPPAPVESPAATAAPEDTGPTAAPTPAVASVVARPTTVPRDSLPRTTSHDSRPHGGYRPGTRQAQVIPLPASGPPPYVPAPPAELRFTCARCGREKPVERFARRGGRHARNCLTCEWLIRRRRHYEAALGHELLTRHAHTLAEGDPLLDGHCVLDCGVALVVGAEVVGVEVLVAHLGCFRAATALTPIMAVDHR